MQRLLYCLFLFSVIPGCKNDGRISHDSNFYSNDTPGLIRYIEDSTVKDGPKELFVQNLGKLMGLPAMGNGEESWNIRIWSGDTDTTNFVVNITDSSEPKAYAVKYNFKKIGGVDYISIQQRWNNLFPKSGWEDFFEKIHLYEIADLKVQNSGYHDLTGGAYVQFEIVRNNTYRYYRALEPSYFKYVSKSSRNIYEFLEYFNGQMNMQLYDGEKGYYKEPKDSTEY
jgi:hypothetical protein